MGIVPKLSDFAIANTTTEHIAKMLRWDYWDTQVREDVSMRKLSENARRLLDRLLLESFKKKSAWAQFEDMTHLALVSGIPRQRLYPAVEELKDVGIVPLGQEFCDRAKRAFKMRIHVRSKDWSCGWLIDPDARKTALEGVARQTDPVLFTPDLFPPENPYTKDRVEKAIKETPAMIEGEEVSRSVTDSTAPPKGKVSRSVTDDRENSPSGRGQVSRSVTEAPLKDSKYSKSCKDFKCTLSAGAGAEEKRKRPVINPEREWAVINGPSSFKALCLTLEHDGGKWRNRCRASPKSLDAVERLLADLWQQKKERTLPKTTWAQWAESLWESTYNPDLPRFGQQSIETDNHGKGGEQCQLCKQPAMASEQIERPDSFFQEIDISGVPFCIPCLAKAIGREPRKCEQCGRYYFLESCVNRCGRCSDDYFREAVESSPCEDPKTAGWTLSEHKRLWELDQKDGGNRAEEYNRGHNRYEGDGSKVQQVRL